MSTAIKYPVPDRVKPSFVIFDIWALWRSGWASPCPDVKNYKWRLYPVWHRILYSCTHVATVGVKGLRTCGHYHVQHESKIDPSSVHSSLTSRCLWVSGYSAGNRWAEGSGCRSCWDSQPATSDIIPDDLAVLMTSSDRRRQLMQSSVNIPPTSHNYHVEEIIHRLSAQHLQKIPNP